MDLTNLPKTYEGYNVTDLLKVLSEIQGGGTTAPEEMILAMGKLVKEYRLTAVYQLEGLRSV